MKLIRILFNRSFLKSDNRCQIIIYNTLKVVGYLDWPFISRGCSFYHFCSVFKLREFTHFCTLFSLPDVLHQTQLNIIL